MVNRYAFYSIFGKNPQTGNIYPLFNMRINGVSYLRLYSIPRGPSFGGVDIYRVEGRDLSGIWNSTTKVLTIVGIL